MNPAQVWDAFISRLQSGAVDSIPIQPYHPALLEPLRQVLAHLCVDADWNEWSLPDEVHPVKAQVHYLLSLTHHFSRETYCFSFLVEEGRWYFQHVESISMRLDLLGPLPARRFPDLPEAKKAWMREEIRVSEMVRLFNWLAEAKGRAFALERISLAKSHLYHLPYRRPRRSPWQPGGPPGHPGRS